MKPGWQRTWTLAWYNVVLDAGTAAGSLIASLPVAIGRWAGKDILFGYRYILLWLAVLGIMSALAYLFLSRSVEIEADYNPTKRKVSPESRQIVTRLSLLFQLMHLAGFLADALIFYWFSDDLEFLSRALDFFSQPSIF